MSAPAQLWAGGLALALAAILTPAAGAVAVRLGIVDRPGAFKPQTKPVPYLGGVAVLVALAVPVLIEEPGFLLALIPASLLGLVDDLRRLPPLPRLAVEAGIGSAVAAVVPSRGALGAAVIVLATVTLINAVNFLDGLDALAAGVGAVAAVGFALVLSGSVLAAGLAGALGGFLLHNRPPARIYLGDAGSYLIGTGLALLLAESWSSGRPPELWVAGVLLVAVPVAEIIVDVLRRLRTRVPLFAHERSHVYDQLVARGWGSGSVVLVFAAGQVVLVALAVVATEVPALAAPSITLAVAGLLAVVWLGRFTTWVGPWQRQ